MCAIKCRLTGILHLLQISRRELENIQQGKGKITRLHTKLSRLTQVGSQHAVTPDLVNPHVNSQRGQQPRELYQQKLRCIKRVPDCTSAFVA